mmetsp:Transcript_7349/g.20092  ORF Transcript_7349/g.20092 Transcript_7349/m.20092 type:complete len:285 (+) Transcript_7349:1515-2369(+)
MPEGKLYKRGPADCTVGSIGRALEPAWWHRSDKCCRWAELTALTLTAPENSACKSSRGVSKSTEAGSIRCKYCCCEVTPLVPDCKADAKRTEFSNCSRCDALNEDTLIRPCQRRSKSCEEVMRSPLPPSHGTNCGVALRSPKMVRAALSALSVMAPANKSCNCSEEPRRSMLMPFVSDSSSGLTRAVISKCALCAGDNEATSITPYKRQFNCSAALRLSTVIWPDWTKLATLSLMARSLGSSTFTKAECSKTCSCDGLKSLTLTALDNKRSTCPHVVAESTKAR